MNKLRKLIIHFIGGFLGLCNKINSIYSIDKMKKQFAYVGKNVNLGYPFLIKGAQNIYLSDYTNISPNSTILTTRAKFIVKEYSGAAEGLTVITGSHMMIPGRFFKTVTDIEKTKEYDKDVVVNEDVWIGANVTILMGVTIGRGAVIGTGSVVRNSVPPYATVLGNPAKVVGFRFTPEEIIEHEKLLYPQEKQIPFEKLQNNHEKYFANRVKDIRDYLKNI